MAPAKQKRAAPRRRPPPPLSVPHDVLGSLTLMIGELRGELSSHVQAVMQDRAERENDRDESAQYRKEVRHTLRGIDMKFNSLDTHAARIKTLEETADDYRKFRNRLAGVMLAAGFFWSLAALYIKDKIFGKGA